MFQNSRLNGLLEYLLTHKSCVSSSKLNRHFSISERTLRNDIRDMNNELKKHGAQILTKRNEGYYLQLDDPSTGALLEKMLQENRDSLDSADSRIHHLLLKLLYSKEYLCQDALADEVFVSVNTIINYVKAIRSFLSKYGLSLQTKANLGYLAVGREICKRRCIMHLITSSQQQYAFQFSHEQRTVLAPVDLDLLTEILISFNREQDIHFSDYTLKNLILQIGLSISRIRYGAPLDASETENYQFLNPLLNPLIRRLETVFQIRFENSEKNYIYSHYISNTGALTRPQLDDSEIRRLTERILHFIYESYRIDLRTDTTLIEDLSHHLSSILNAKFYQLNQSNPLLHTIKNNYLLAYEISETAVSQAFENLSISLSEDDVAYVALHIGASIERYFDSRYVRRKRALVVYENGYAEGSFLASKLTSLFKNVLEIKGKYPSHELNETNCRDIDLIISTAALKAAWKIPVVMIEMPLRRKDIEHVARAAHIMPHPVSEITQFFSPSLFLRAKGGNRDEIIHALCALLKQEGCVNDAFEESVLDREARISTAMDGVLALPHPLSICSMKSRVAVAILEKPVKWSQKNNAQIILMLSLTDDKKKEMKLLYDTFVAIANNAPLETLLLQAASIQEFLQILKDNIPEEEY